MAKISARGARKLLEATRIEPADGPNGPVERILVLRSDGVVLRTYRWPEHPSGTYWRSRNGYKTHGTFPKDCPDIREAFRKHCAKRGYEVRS